MKNLSLTVLILAVVFALAPQANAQCPAQPLNTFAGTWVFHTEGVALTGLAAVGRIVASVGTDKAGNPTGVLNVVETSNWAGTQPTVFGVSVVLLLNALGTVNRFLTYQGRYTIFPDCSGGSMDFNNNFNSHVQYDFYYQPGPVGLEIVFVSTNGPSFIVPVSIFQGPSSTATERISVQPILAGSARKIS